MTAYKLVNMSHNAKTGPMPAIYVSKDSCPPTCGLYNQCYAKIGPTGIHFNNAANGASFDSMLEWVRNLPVKMWRYGVSGDLPGNGRELNQEQIQAIVKANGKKTPIVYTHYQPTQHNINVIKAVSNKHFTINVSCDSIEDIKTVVNNGINAVTYTSPTDTRKTWTQDSIKFVTCPNQTSPKKPTCSQCQLCSKKRDYVIVFRSHGIQKNKVSAVV